MGHDPLVGHGAQRLDIQFPCQVDVAGADKAAREIVAQHTHHFFLHTAGKAPAGAEVGHLQFGQFIFAGMRTQPVELAVQLVARFGQAHVRVQMAVAHFADDGQQRHFEQDHMQPRAFQAQEQLVVFYPQAYVAQVEAEQAQKAQEVGLEEADAFEERELAVIQGEVAEQFELVADLAEVGAQVLAVAAAEFPFDVGVRVVVQHALHHGEFVEVGVEQVVHDALGECALAHQWGSGSGEWRTLCQPFRPCCACCGLIAGKPAPTSNPQGRNLQYSCGSWLAGDRAGTAKTEVFFRAPASLETVPPVAVAHQLCAVR
ncbi:hypothetical protein D3C76_798510 [compost metagenome]